MITPRIRREIGRLMDEGFTEGEQSEQDGVVEPKVGERELSKLDRRNLSPRLIPENSLGRDMMRNETGNPIEILLIEDNVGDVGLMREALSEAKVPNRLHVAQDGIEALQFLKKEHQYAGSPSPDLVVLDLNIPRRNGFEVLDLIKSDPQFKRIPVIILTSSKAEADVLKCYNSHANAYVTKPGDFDRYVNVVKIIDEFWLSTVRLPGREI
jgi:two-component system, chemotaxis family, response regulator Rcp1